MATSFFFPFLNYLVLFSFLDFVGDRGELCVPGARESAWRQADARSRSGQTVAGGRTTMFSASWSKGQYEVSMGVRWSKPASFTSAMSRDNALTGKEIVSCVLGILSVSLDPNSLFPLSGLGRPDLQPSLAN